MSYIIAVSKQGVDVKTATDPNDLVFSSEYNTFKIVRTGVKVCELAASTNGQLFTEPHFLDFTPLVNAMAYHDGYNQAFPVNTPNIYFFGSKAGLFSSGVTFVSIKADANNIIFEFDCSSGSPQTVRARYYCIETI